MTRTHIARQECLRGHRRRMRHLWAFAIEALLVGLTFSLVAVT